MLDRLHGLRTHVSPNYCLSGANLLLSVANFSPLQRASLFFRRLNSAPLFCSRPAAVLTLVFFVNCKWGGPVYAPVCLCMHMCAHLWCIVRLENPQCQRFADPYVTLTFLACDLFEWLCVTMYNCIGALLVKLSSWHLFEPDIIVTFLLDFASFVLLYKSYGVIMRLLKFVFSKNCW